MESFADVLHSLIDHVLTGDLADKAHDIIDRASGVRTAQEPASAPETPAAPEATVPGDVPTEDAPATPEG